jgi:hypothetical protein
VSTVRTCFVIPMESMTEVTGAGPFDGDGVDFLEGVGEMVVWPVCGLPVVYKTPKSSSTKLKIMDGYYG